MRRDLLTSLIAFVCLISLRTSEAQEPEPPKVLHEDFAHVELVAQEPNIVTPVGLTFDDDGRLLVIESHTHFPPDGYKGPKYDRIRCFEDTTGDGTFDRVSNFLTGLTKTMSIRRGPNDWIYIATRMQIVRVRDTNGDGRADETQLLARLETQGDYPHNGLGGLCFDELGHLYFGFGENLGLDYKLIAHDGTQLSGGGEGGSVFRIGVDGADLHRVATGFWNPFAICHTQHNRLFAVGNDPDASPPCRLVHIVKGGDYGYQFRYGRSGKHPLQAWDGELPGTLPMAGATGEAPSGVINWHGQLYCSSWGEHWIERFRILPNGASVTTERELVVKGDAHFRPVDFAIGPDNALYFTDWVDRSYNVHGRGRVWRLKWKGEPRTTPIPQLSNEELRAANARTTIDWDAADSTDPFLHQAAVQGLVANSLDALSQLRQQTSPRRRLAILQAARQLKLPDAQVATLLDAAFKDSDEDVRLFALRWIADARLTRYQEPLTVQLKQSGNSSRFLVTALATIDWLERGAVENGKVAGENLLVAAISDPTASPALTSLALQLLPPHHEALSTTMLARLLKAEVPDEIKQEAARCLALSPHPEAAAVCHTRLRTAIEQVESNRDDAAAKAATPWVADLVLGLKPEKDAALLQRLADPNNQLSDSIRQTAHRQMLDRSTAEFASSNTAQRPPLDQLDAWLQRLEGQADAAAGWRVFFGNTSARCANCHRLGTRGADIGPDLTMIGRRIERRRLIESLLQPNREVAPRYQPWLIETSDGKTITALSLGVPGSGPVEDLLRADGTQVQVTRDTIVARHLLDQSIMPTGLTHQLTLSEIRDLLAALNSDDTVTVSAR